MILLNVIGVLVILAGVAQAQQELPNVKVPDKFFHCKVDKDCAIAGDACRSCGKLIVINRKFLKNFDALDQKERKRKNVHRACEACSTQQVVLKCAENRCRQDVKAP
jgi:hypothetical protein